MTTSRSADLLDAGVKEMALVPAVEPNGLVMMIERLAANPDVNVEKLERLIAMQERIAAHQAKAAFDSAFATMQPEIPQITERGEIAVRGQVRSTYAKLEDIHEVVKPIMARHGFALRYRTEWPVEHSGVIRIVGILSHEQGHSEESAFEAPADKSEFRSEVQSQGSTVSYGRRYTTLDLLAISTRGQDDDGRKSGAPQSPAGYDEWKIKLSETANRGIVVLEKAFADADVKFRNYLTNHDALDFAKMRTRARTGKAAS